MRRTPDSAAVVGVHSANPGRSLEWSLPGARPGIALQSASHRRRPVRQRNGPPRAACLAQGCPGIAVPGGPEAPLAAPDQPGCGEKASATATAACRPSVRSPCSGLLQLHDVGDGDGEAVPVGSLFFELLPSEPGQSIKFCAPMVVARFPLASDPSFLFQLVQSRIE